VFAVAGVGRQRRHDTSSSGRSAPVKKAVALAFAILVLAATPAVAVGADRYLGAQAPPAKQPSDAVPVDPPHRQVGGDTFGNATAIGDLPYADGGNTCSFTDDYDVPCISSAGAPDVVYRISPTANICITVSTCNGSTYDTALHVYQNDINTLVACNDDFCGLQSTIAKLQLVAGNTYYIVVDGYSTLCGDYVMEITRCSCCCNSQCPPGAILEGEPDCGNGYVDSYNGGCNSTPPVFTNLLCNDTGVTVCGRYGTYLSASGQDFRDTDWYRIVIGHPVILELCLCGTADSRIFVIDGNHGCPVLTPDILCTAFGSPGESICCTIPLAPGTYYLFAAPNVFTGVPCGSAYTFTVTGYECPPVAATPANWSQVKTIYR
jgi:hypothetical protein